MSVFIRNNSEFDYVSESDKSINSENAICNLDCSKQSSLA